MKGVFYMKETKIDDSMIRVFMWKNKLTKKKFCEMCGISYAVLNKILNNKRNFYLTALLKVARVMNVELYQMFVEC